jgi:hypothetical protein
MKTLTLFLNLLITTTLFSQYAFFIHVTTPENSSGNLTVLDHPMLNNNPSAHLIITHNADAGHPDGVYNNNVTGVFYSNFIQRWTIFNENQNPIVNLSAYNVYVESGNQAFIHIADESNIGVNGDYDSVIDNPLMNGNPGANAVFSNYFNPFEIYNNKNFGLWYDESLERWIISESNAIAITLQTAFFFVGGENKNQDVIAFSYEAVPSDISPEVMRINHPYLNNNPDAIFVISHNWGVTGDTSNVNVTIPVTVSYWDWDNRWYILSEDSSNFEVGTKFNIMMDSAFLSTNIHNTLSTTLYPNPATDQIHFKAQDVVDSITIFDNLGRVVWQEEVNSTATTIDISRLNNGVYIILAKANSAVSTQKFIKK